MSDGFKWEDNDRTRNVAHAFNAGIDGIKEATGEKAKLQSMQISQSEVLDNLGNAYDFSAERGDVVPRVKYMPRRESRNYLKQGEISAQFEYLQAYDALTSFLNERGVRDELLQRVAHVNRSENNGFGIVVMDIKNFKYLNDALGQNGGDAVLKEIAASIVENSRDEDSFWRIAGDEMAVLMDSSSATQLENLIFKQRHNRDPEVSIVGWLESVNRAVKSKLTNLVVNTKLEGVDLGDSGELRAGVFYVDKTVIEKLEGQDILGGLIKGAKNKLEDVKEEQRSQSMVWKKLES